MPFSIRFCCHGLLLSWFSLLGLGCVAAPVRELTVFDSPRGWVHLAKSTGSQFQASHPLSIDPVTLVRTLTGIRVQSWQGQPTTLFFGPARSVQVFSKEDAVLLAPFIAAALGEASAQQVVTFGAIHALSRGPAASAGFIYAQGPYLYVTLTQYRSRLPSDTQQDMPDFSRMYDLEVGFTPEGALDQSAPRPSLSGLGELTTLAVDYTKLTAMPESTTAESSLRPSAATASDSQAQGRTSEDSEVERLKKENRALQRRLLELEAEMTRQKLNSRGRP